MPPASQNHSLRIKFRLHQCILPKVVFLPANRPIRAGQYPRHDARKNELRISTPHLGEIGTKGLVHHSLPRRHPHRPELSVHQRCKRLRSAASHCLKLHPFAEKSGVDCIFIYLHRRLARCCQGKQSLQQCNVLFRSSSMSRRSKLTFEASSRLRLLRIAAS